MADKQQILKRLLILQTDILQMSQSDFCAKLNIDYGLLDIVYGHKSITGSLCRAICKVFLVSKNWLFHGQSPIFDERTSKFQVERLYRLQKDILQVPPADFCSKIGFPVSDYANEIEWLSIETMNNICKEFQINRQWILFGYNPIFTPEAIKAQKERFVQLQKNILSISQEAFCSKISIPVSIFSFIENEFPYNMITEMKRVSDAFNVSLEWMMFGTGPIFMGESKQAKIDRLIELRKNILKLSQSDFSSKLNIQRATLSHIENGRNELTARTIDDICRAFHVSKEWIVSGKGSVFVEVGEQELLEEIVEYYSKLDEKYRHELRGYVQRLWEEQQHAKALEKHTRANGVRLKQFMKTEMP